MRAHPNCGTNSGQPCAGLYDCRPLLAHPAVPQILVSASGRARSGPCLAACAVTISADEAPEWIELIPAGKFFAVDERGPFENENPDRVIAASVAKMPKVGLVLDYDHSTDLAAPEGRPAPAAGWLKAFKVENGAIFARIEWTVDAAEAVKAKKYRYVSPVFEHSKDAKVERILRAALTNNPALINLPALASAGQLAHAPESRDKGAAAHARSVEKMAKDGDAKKMKLSEMMAMLEEAYPDAGPDKLMKAAACLIADDSGDGDEYMHAAEQRNVQGNDPYESENEEQLAARQAEEMARCASDEERSHTAAKHAAEKARMAKRIRGLEVQNSNEKSGMAAGRSGSRTIQEIEAMVAKHPMMLKMASDLNRMRATQARKTAETSVDNAIREGRLVPSQRDWAIEYCSSDPSGFDKFIGAQPRILQSGPDGTFTGRIGEAPADELSQKELMVCERLGVTAEKFAAARKARLSHNVHLD